MSGHVVEAAFLVMVIVACVSGIVTEVWRGVAVDGCRDRPMWLGRWGMSVVRWAARVVAHGFAFIGAPLLLVAHVLFEWGDNQ